MESSLNIIFVIDVDIFFVKIVLKWWNFRTYGIINII